MAAAKNGPTPIDRDYHGPLVSIPINALNVRQVGEGKWAVDLPARVITNAQNELLNDLFPNTQRQIHILLSTEAMIGAIDNNALAGEAGL